MGFVADMFNPSKGAGFTAYSGQGANPADADKVRDVIGQQQAFVNALQAQGGIGNQSNVFNQQQALANQLQQQTQGAGPNPALLQLQQATGQNVANQAALMASQRGVSSNPALLARMAAQQGAGIQQNAANQAAQLRAEQMLAAQRQLQAQQQAMAGLSTQQVAQQAGALGGLGQQAQGLFSSQIQDAAQQNQANAGIAQGNQKQQGQLLGGLLNAGGAAFGLAKGGEVPGYADGGEAGPKSTIGKMFSSMGSSMTDNKDQGVGMGLNSIADRIRASRNVPSMPNAPSVFAPAQIGGLGASDLMTAAPAMAMAAHGGQIKNLKAGGKVPGEAQVAGDNEVNDTVPAMLSPKEIVLPRSVTLHPNAPEKAAEFVAAVQARKKMGKRR